MEILKWPKDETRFVLIGKLSYIVEKSGTSSEQFNASYNSNSLLNLTGGGNSSGLSNNLNNSLSTTSSKIWSRALKFSLANAVLVVRSAAPATVGETLSLSADFLNDTSLNHNNLLDVANFSDSFDLNDSIKFNSANRKRSNSKSPLRMSGGNLLSVINSQQNSLKSGSQFKGHEAMLILFKEKNGRYTLCRVCWKINYLGIKLN